MKIDRADFEGRWVEKKRWKKKTENRFSSPISRVLDSTVRIVIKFGFTNYIQFDDCWLKCLRIVWSIFAFCQRQSHSSLQLQWDMWYNDGFLFVPQDPLLTYCVSSSCDTMYSVPEYAYIWFLSQLIPQCLLSQLIPRCHVKHEQRRNLSIFRLQVKSLSSHRGHHSCASAWVTWILYDMATCESTAQLISCQFCSEAVSW